MSRLRSIAWGASLAAAAAACGYPHITYDTSSATGATGGGGSTTTTAPTSSSTSGTGGTAACGPIGSPCGSGAKCSVNLATGAPTCITLDASTASPWSACTLDRECPLEHFCDPHNKICKPVCSGSCSPCVSVHDQHGDKISGLTVCVAACEPELSLQCGSGATCAWDPNIPNGTATPGAFDCFQDGTKNFGESCSPGVPPQCVSGYVCALGQCRDWCVTSPDDCLTGYCADFDSFTPAQDGKTYGFCL